MKLSKKLAFGIVPLMLLGLAGCNNLSDPQLAAASAYSDLMKGNYGDFEKALTGDALTQYGNASAESQLQTKLAGLKVTMGKDQYVGSEPVNFNETLYFYNLPVLGNGAPVLQLGIVCDMQTPNWCNETNPLPGPYPAPGAPNCPMNLVSCKISSIAE